MPVYNGADTIMDSIQSVINQEYTDWELIVVNDGSTDGTSSIVKSVNDSRIKLVEIVNGGVSTARNTGIGYSVGRFVCFLDADDIWYPAFLSSIYEMYSNYPLHKIFATNYYFQDNLEVLYLPKGVPEIESPCILYNYLELLCKCDPVLNTNTIVIDRELLRSIGGFPEKIKAGEDTLTWIKLSLTNDIVYLSTPLSVYKLPLPGNRKIRTSDTEDLFELEIQNLVNDFPQRKEGLFRVLSHWYKIRSSTYLQHGRNQLAMRYAMKAFRYSFQKSKLLVYIVLSLLPSTVSKPVFIYLLTK